MFAISSNGSNEYLFGQHDGHLSDKAAYVASLYGCRLVRFTDPKDGTRRGLFATPNRSDADNKETAAKVLRAINSMGGFDALRMRYEEFLAL
jgi:hypothetical protein